MSISSIHAIFRINGDALLTAPELKDWTQDYGRLKMWVYCYWLVLSCIPLGLLGIGGHFASVEFTLAELLVGVCFYAVMAEQGLSAMLESLDRVKPLSSDQVLAERVAHMAESWPLARDYIAKVQAEGRSLALVDYDALVESVRDPYIQSARALKSQFGGGAPKAEAAYRRVKLSYYAHVGLPIFVVLVIVAGALVWAGVSPVWQMPFLALLGTLLHNAGLAEHAKRRVYLATPVWLAPEVESRLKRLQEQGGEGWQVVQAVLAQGQGLRVEDVPDDPGYAEKS